MHAPPAPPTTTMPLPAPPTQKLDNATNRLASAKADKDLLIKGVLCALVGIVILAGPTVARASSIQELLAGASVVGWFSLLLGCAFLGLYAKRRITASRGR